MRHSPILSTTLVISIVSLAGCEIAGDIFKAGVWVGSDSGDRNHRACYLDAYQGPKLTRRHLFTAFWCIQKVASAWANLKGRVNSIPA